MGKVVLGDFDTERFWDNPRIAKLPSIKLASSNQITFAMEELLLTFCGNGESIITRHVISQQLVDYYQTIGISVGDRYSLSEVCDPSNYDTSLPTLLLENPCTGKWLQDQELEPFAVSQHMDKLVCQYNIKNDIAKEAAAQKVNSKLYSCRLRDEVKIENHAFEISSVADLEQAFSTIINHGQTCILKEEYGVSGRGNLLISSPEAALHIIDYFTNQVNNGKELQLVAEPFLKKQMDFSCQFHISPSGQFRLISIYELSNNELAYAGTRAINNAFYMMLQANGYITLMERIANHLFRDGYFGYVCVDSMLLANGCIEPIVEINARKSMSMIKHALDNCLHLSHDQSVLYSQNVLLNDATFPFEKLLQKLKQERLLYLPATPSGIIILSEQTIFSNKRPGKYRGRLYFVVVESDKSSANKLLDRFKCVLQEADYRLV